MQAQEHEGSSLRHSGSVVVVCGLSCRKAYEILVHQPGIEPVSPALEGGFLTTGPPEKYLIHSTLPSGVGIKLRMEQSELVSGLSELNGTFYAPFLR